MRHLAVFTVDTVCNTVLLDLHNLTDIHVTSMYIIHDTQLPMILNIMASQYLGQDATHKMDQEVNCTV